MLWKTYSTIRQSIPQRCGKLEGYAVENSNTFPHFILLVENSFGNHVCASCCIVT